MYDPSSPEYIEMIREIIESEVGNVSFIKRLEDGNLLFRTQEGYFIRTTNGGKPIGTDNRACWKFINNIRGTPNIVTVNK